MRREAWAGTPITPRGLRAAIRVNLALIRANCAAVRVNCAVLGRQAGHGSQPLLAANARLLDENDRLFAANATGFRALAAVRS